MSGFSDSTAGLMVQARFGGGGTAPSSDFIALLTTVATNWQTGAGAVEFAAAGYVRIEVVNNATNWAAPVGRGVSNDVNVSFTSSAPAAWNGIQVVGFAIYSALSGGTWIGGGPLDTSKTLNTGDPVLFSAGDLTISIEAT